MYKSCKLRLFSNFEFVMKDSSEQLRAQRDHKLMYDEFGNLRISGVCTVIYKRYGKQIAMVLSAIAAFYVYEKIIIKLCIDENDKMKRLDRESEESLKQTGKLKDSRYLVKPNRQIDDPDYLNAPSYGGKGVLRSKLEEKENLTDDKLHAEFRRYRG